MPERDSINLLDVESYVGRECVSFFIDILRNKQEKILFLDDNRDRTNFFVQLFPEAISRDMANTIIDAINENPDSYVFLDHDLDGRVYVPTFETNTGSEVVRRILINKPKIKAVIVHSMNEKASEAMVLNLRNSGYMAYYLPWEILKIIVEIQDKKDNTNVLS